MLNTIYEEMAEIGQNFKANNKIKIKKVVKQQDSEGNEVYTLQNCTLLDDSLSLEASNILTQNRIESLFASTLSTISGVDSNLLQIKTDFSNFYDKNEKKEEKMRFFKDNFINNANKRKNTMNLDNKAEFSKPFSQNNDINNKENSLFINNKANNRLFQSELRNFTEKPSIKTVIIQKNPVFPDENAEKRMFRSQSENKTNKDSFYEDLKEFVLPKDVINLLKNQENNINAINSHIIREKYRITDEIEQVIFEINRIISLRKNELFKHLDAYSQEIKENYEFFAEKVKNYKEKALGKSVNKCKTPKLSLKAVKYYIKGLKIKEEKDQKFPQFPVYKLIQELDKKEILVISAELNKKIKHLPLFNHSETSNSLLNDLKSTVFTEINGFFDNFKGFLYETPSNNIKEITIKPQISPVVLCDNLNVIGDFLDKKLNKIVEITDIHKDTIISLLVFDEKTLITGSKAGEIKLWDMGFNHNFSSFSNDSSVNLLCTFEGNEEENKGKEIFKRTLMKNWENHDKRFLITCDNSDSAIKIWDIEKKTVIRSFFTDKITAILALKDGQTLISGSKDGKIAIFDVNSGKTLQILHEDKGKVNCFFLFRDGTRFASGNDHSISIWRFYMGFSLRSQRKTVEKVEFLMALENNSAVLSINQSFLDENTIFSGSFEGIVRIWDLKQKKCRKELKTEIIGIFQMVLCENVWDNNKGNKRVSVMNNEGLEICDSSENEKIEIKVICGKNLQVVKRGDEGIEVIGSRDRNVIVLKLC